MELFLENIDWKKEVKKLSKIEIKIYREIFYYLWLYHDNTATVGHGVKIFTLIELLEEDKKTLLKNYIGKLNRYTCLKLFIFFRNIIDGLECKA